MKQIKTVSIVGHPLRMVTSVLAYCEPTGTIVAMVKDKPRGPTELAFLKESDIVLRCAKTGKTLLKGLFIMGLGLLAEVRIDQDGCVTRRAAGY